jgi:phage terminase large subunit-like protein
MPEAGLSSSLTKWNPESDLSPAERIARLSKPDRQKLLQRLSTKQAESLRWDWTYWARPSQLPPSDNEWVYWMMMAGRGSGKTRSGSEWVRRIKETHGLIALVGSTWGDVRDVMVHGPAGLLPTAPPGDTPRYEGGSRRVIWSNGAAAYLYSAERPDRLRGPQFHAAWCDELAAWAYPDDTWSNLQFGMRLGKMPRTLITTTPRPIKLVRELLKDPLTRVSRTSSYANRAHLAPTYINQIIKRYEGTRLGRQEIYAEVLEDAEGALWSQSGIDRDRVPFGASLPELARIVVAIDPAVTSGEESDETGIIIAAKDFSGHAYILGDASGRYLPSEWAKKAIELYRNPDRPADRIIAEVNNGGEMVEHTLRMIDPGVPYKAVHASRGRVIRAEPVSALYEQHRVHHFGTFPALEDQMCSFTIDYNRSRDGSPDRVDALVWALTELLVEDSGNSYLDAWGKW